ncbi:MAG: pyridoxal phosphate-dependent decarboxylase family protein [Pirellulaceae bacterium]
MNHTDGITSRRPDQEGIPLCDGTPLVEETLDPEDWSVLRVLGHQMLDDMFDSMSAVRDRPVWQPMPEAVKQRLRTPVPFESTDANQVYEEFKRTILPYPTGNTHPRFWGWVMGTGTPIGMLADMLISGMNAHGAGYDQAAPVVERQVIEWIADLLGLPQQTSGLFVSGASVGNMIGLAVARNVKAGFDVRHDGLQNSQDTRLVVYCSTETHSWAQRAVELLGLGSRALHRVPVGEDFRIDLGALRTAISQDRSQGLRPICIIGNAGTVNTGAFDDLLALAEICRDQELWFHVDGAFGAWAAISNTSRSLVSGLELADSMGVDLHKWLYLPFEVGCSLVRDPERHRQTFAVAPAYLTAARRGILAEPMIFADLGLDLSRSFKALKVWMSFKVHGVGAFGRLIDQNIQQARYLAGIIEQSPDMECLAPVSLNIVCFRFRPAGYDEQALDALNDEILCQLQESGTAVTSGTRIQGRFAIRVAITNHRSQRADFDLLINTVREFGERLVERGPAAGEAAGE